MTPGRIVGVIVGAILGLLGLGLIAAGTVTTVAYAIVSDDGGYFDATLERLSTPTAAITTEEVDLQADPGPPDWFKENVDFTVRIQAEAATAGTAIFVGIGPRSDVNTYLGAIARDEIRDVRPGGDVRYRALPGDGAVDPPTEQGFWVASASGPGNQELTWEFAEGNWVAVLMNADGSTGIIADVTVGAKTPLVLPIGIAMLVFGFLILIAAVVIIVLAAAAGRSPQPASDEEQLPPEREPVTVEAAIDSPLSQWLWLVKWFLAIPHFFVLVFLWIAFIIMTLIAGFAILFTARYPRGIFDFNVGVMRWSWRVSCYAGTGGLNTDRYPPFTLDDVPDYPARFDVAYPTQLSRGLVLVKWWLLAIPHYLVVAILVGAGAWWCPTWAGGLIGLLVFIAVVTLLFSGRYPGSLFDLIIGLNRWVMRVAAYASLMTDRYPPFRLDQGGTEPDAEVNTQPRS